MDLVLRLSDSQLRAHVSFCTCAWEPISGSGLVLQGPGCKHEDQ